jgi:Fe-S-cluster containining protein
MVDTFYLHLEFKSKNQGWSINVPFVCDKCGICCTLDDFLTAGEVKINPLENPQLQTKLKEIYEEMGRLWEVDEAKYNQYIMHNPCPFVKDKTCSIYELRPEGCRQFPNTTFGFLTQDCMALTRFKKQCAALNKGRTAKKAYYSTSEPLKRIKYTEEQYQNCINKLLRAGMSKEELSLFGSLNNHS